jgi:plasmid stability protein
MAQLTVRQVDDRVVQKLKERAAKNNRSAEAEHREILQTVLLQDERTRAEFIERAAKLRSRLRSSKDSTSLIRRDRDRDTRK